MFWTFDTETKPIDDEGTQGLVCVSLYNGTDVHTFFTQHDFKDFVMKNVSGRLYAHNTAFDVPILFFNEAFSDVDFDEWFAVRNALLPSFKTEAGKVQVLDSVLLFPMSLSKLTKAAGGEEKTEFDIRKWQEEGCPITEELIYYNQMDVISLHSALTIMFDEFRKLGITEIEKTIAGTAFKYVQNQKYLGSQIKTLTNTLPHEVEKHVRKAYFGGRCEPFFIGELENVRHIDKRSMYPYCLSTYEYPIFSKNKNEWEFVEGSTHAEFLENFDFSDMAGVFHVKVRVPETACLPPIPLRTKKGLRFPIGVFETDLLLEEILLYKE